MSGELHNSGKFKLGLSFSNIKTQFLLHRKTLRDHYRDKLETVVCLWQDVA
jgi:hypothetical protein